MNISLPDAELIATITQNAGRACFDYSFPHDSMKCAKAIMAFHVGGVPLDLASMSKAEGLKLIAEVRGIQSDIQKHGKPTEFKSVFAKEGVK